MISCVPVQADELPFVMSYMYLDIKLPKCSIGQGHKQADFNANLARFFHAANTMTRLNYTKWQLDKIQGRQQVLALENIVVFCHHLRVCLTTSLYALAGTKIGQIKSCISCVLCTSHS